MAALLDALPGGSYLVASHVTPEHDPEGAGGPELVDPGVVLVSEWRPQDSSGPRPPASDVNWYGGIGHKPL